MQRPGRTGCRVPPQSLTVPPRRAWGLFLAPTPQSPCSGSPPKLLPQSRRETQIHSHLQNRLLRRGGQPLHLPLDTTLRPAPHRGLQKQWESAAYICIMKSTVTAPPTQEQISALIKTVYHPNLGTCQRAGDNPVLQEMAMLDLFLRALQDRNHLCSPGTNCIQIPAQGAWDW